MNSGEPISCLTKITLMLFIALLLLSSLSMASTPSNQPHATLPQDISQDWWQSIHKDIIKSEYDVKWQEETCIPGLISAWQAINRSHNLRAYFIPEGIRVTPGDSNSESWTWGLSLVKYGMESSLKQLGPVEPEIKGNKVVYHRDSIDEWYINNEQGIEQGFTIPCPPDSTNSESSKMILTMKIEGDLKASTNSAKDLLELKTNDGTSVIRMANLKVYDKDGDILPASYRLTNRTVDILIDITNATYPITVDPMIESPIWTAESNHAYTSFTCSVSTAGDVNGDGYSDIIIADYRYYNEDLPQGRAFVYYGSPYGPSDIADWTAKPDEGDPRFGELVATAGDVNGDGYADIIIASSRHSNAKGRVLVYHGSPSGLSNIADWTAESNKSISYFGNSVASAGDVNGDGYSDIIVGAYNYCDPAYRGRAFVYYGSATGLSSTPDWTKDGDQDKAYFGSAVATAGDVNGDGFSDVIITALGYDNGEEDEGRAFVYHGSPSGLSDTANWTVESNQAETKFGISVSTAGDVNGDGYSDVIIGDNRYDNGEEDEGRTFVYHGSPSGLSGTANWTAESNQYSANFGVSVATAGDVNGDGYSDVLVGAIDYSNDQSEEGRAFLYYGSASGLSISADLTMESNQLHAHFGNSVATAGDVNGDGYSDILIGAIDYDNGETDEGRAFLYYGNDDDGDGMLDNWEIQFFGDTSRDGSGDYDNDDLTNFLEFKNGTNPLLSDTDGDGMGDGFEINYFGDFTRDGSEDYDGDWYTDLEEYENGTDPTIITDTDSDGIPDGFEIHYFGGLSRDGFGDFDNDGVTDLEEFTNGTNPTTNLDIDNDNMPDDWEINYFNDTTRDGTQDADGDDLTDIEEYEAGTDPTLTDTDGDGMSDAFEITYFGDLTNNGAGDTDGDGSTDLEEYEVGTNPLLNSSEEGETNYQFERMWPELTEGYYFLAPEGIAIDGDGNIYVADSGNNRIKKFDSDMTLITSWGSYGEGDGKFNNPKEIEIDSNGFVYVVDEYNHRIQKFTSNGEFVSKWGTQGSEDSQFSYPYDIVIDSNDYIYVSDSHNKRIQKFTSDGVFVIKWETIDNDTNKLYYPGDIAIDNNGYVCVVYNGLHKFTQDGQFVSKLEDVGGSLAIDGDNYLYFGERTNTRIIKFDSEGQYILTIQLPWDQMEFLSDMIYPVGIAIDANNNIYIVDNAWDRVVKFSADGELLEQWKSFGNGEGEFNIPSSVLVDNEGYVHVTDVYNNRIQKFTLGGQFIEQWGGWDIVCYPHDVVIDDEGNFYIADYHMDLIQKFDKNHNLITQWGSSGSDDGQFDTPRAIAMDSGYIYVVDSGNNRIQKFDSNGNFIDKWGSYGSGDGDFYLPQDIAIDSSNNIYIADAGANDRIQVFNSEGDYIDQWGNNGSYDGEFIGSPRSVTIDNDGYVWVADSSRIQKFTPDGQYILKIGELGSEEGQFNSPRGINFSPHGRMYIADTGNNRIQVFKPEGADEDDTDDDGMPDDWENKYFGNLSQDGTTDYDQDNLSDLQEYNYGTSPILEDTDEDGMSDGFEITYFGDNTRDGTGDYDSDYLTDLAEFENSTNPTDSDTDSDGMPDVWEIGFDLDPLTDDAFLDPDKDGYTNLQEYEEGGNPNSSDTPFPWELFIPVFTRK